VFFPSLTTTKRSKQGFSHFVANKKPYFVIDPCGSNGVNHRPLHSKLAMLVPYMKDNLPYSCQSDQQIAYYLNQASVKTALHVRSDLPWDECSFRISYTINTKTTIPLHLRFKNKYRILIYSGTSDSVVSFVGTQRWINSLNLPVKENLRPWYYHDTTFGNSEGGHIQVWDGITLVTIRAAGHMVRREISLPLQDDVKIF
jgi:hypothetical protein